MNIVPGIIDFFICDDVRQEIGGKRTVVGIYGDSLTIPSVPFNLPQLCFVFKMDLAKSNITKMIVTIEMPANQIIGPFDVGMPKKVKLQNILNLAVYPVNIKGTGMCQVFVSFDDQKKIKLGQLEIKLTTQ